ncbi:MAG: 50S ribosomal protein L4 [archaeon]
MKVKVKTLEGESKTEIVLPAQFEEELRPDLIKRAVLAIQSHKRQPYGSDPEAGKKYSAKLSRRRRDYKGAYGHGISRVPRKIMSHKGTRFNWQGATAPNTVGGRVAHPPKVEKIWDQKINIKERRKAIRSALSASVVKELIVKRGHHVEDYPLVIEDSFEDLMKAKQVVSVLVKLGLTKELARSERKTRKSGIAARRGRPFKKAKGPLLVVSKKCNLINAASNIPGIEIITVESLNAELLAPGCDYGRLTIYTKGSIDKIGNEQLFTGIKSDVTKKPAATQKVEKPKAEKPKTKTVKKVKSEVKK